MIKIIRDYLLNKTLLNAKAGPYVGWTKVKTVTILADTSTERNSSYIFLLKDRLEKDGKTTNFMTFAPQKRPKEKALQNTYYKSDLYLFGKPKKNVAEAISSDADVLINWALEEDSPNDFIAAAAKSSLKIGVGHTLSCYDLEIKDDANNPQKVVEEIIKYLKMINHE